MSAEDRKEITRLINEWNSSRYELFALSQPNERLEFHGVMRFYFQDTGEKVSTKCVRVESTATTDDVIKVLIEKFRPDMKSLSAPKDYSIYEVHADSQERKLDPNERPLWIQLEWGKEGREGRFLLKNENVKTFPVDSNTVNEGLLRDKKRLSKREKKKLQQQEKQNNSSGQRKGKEKDAQKGKVAEHLYKEVPDSNFTRSISNPEIVMARRRQQKLENKLKQIKNRDGGGTLKVYGETLKPDIPYKTLLLSNQDTAAFAVKETLDKYGLSSEDPDNYCLVQVITPSREEREKHGAQIREYILEDNALPLAILMKHPSTGGSIIFQIRRCTPDILAVRKQKKKQEQQQNNPETVDKQGIVDQKQQKIGQMLSQPNLQHQQAFNTAANSTDNQKQANNLTKLPFLVELTYEGFELASPRIIQIKSDFYEIGNDKYMASTHPTNYIRIDPTLPQIDKKHCAIKKSNDNFQVLVIPYAETYVNDRLINEPTQLFNGFTLRLGKYCLFRLENPNETGLISGLNNQMLKQNEPAPTPQKQNQVANYGLLYDSGQVVEPAHHALQSQSMSNINSRMINGNSQMGGTGINAAKAAQTIATTSNGNMQANNGGESGLPGLLEFSDEREDLLLQHICSPHTPAQFKLAPVYTLYMMLRFRLSQKYKPEYSFGDKLHSLGLLIHKMVNYIREAVDQAHLDKHLLPYWLANSSELLYFLKQDVHLAQQSLDAQEALAECVQTAFKYLVNLMQQQLDLVLVAFFDPSDLVEDVNFNQPDNRDNMETELMNGRPSLRHVIQVLNETMSLLRGSRVNAALTIQLFSQLFHYISMSLFNRLVRDQRCTGLCSRYWGEKLSRRLSKIQIWAEKQGLELAADCHLQRIIQASFFLQAPKHDIQQLSTISSNCFTLNSAQIKCLLKNYLLGNQEPPLSAQLCNNLISIAQNTADDVLKQEGRTVQVEEEIDLQLPFLLPEDGHSSEFIKGLPAGLLDFLESLQNTGHCWLWQNTQGPGNWKKFMNREQALAQNAQSNSITEPAMKPQIAQQVTPQHQLASNSNVVHGQIMQTPNAAPSAIQQVAQNAPKVIKVKLAKKNNGLGLSIVAARGSNQITGIYVKSVVPGGAASDDGRLSAGDQLLAVDDNSLINVTQERAAELMCKSGPWVILTVAKDAASFHNLDALLNKSPLPQNLPSSQMGATSMPSLNNVQINNINQNQMQNINSAQTLPRSHHMINNSYLDNQHHQSADINLPFHSTNLVGPNEVDSQQAGEFVGFKTRSMSQDILRTPNSPIHQPQIQQQQIAPQVIHRPNSLNNQISSPTNQQQFQMGYPVRTLPNEQQIRYGSERPVSMHSSQFQQPQQISHTDSRFAPQTVQRNLPNEYVPRFGSERPAGISNMTASQHNPPAVVNRFHSNQEPISPIKPQFRQASLNELDEIQYNNKQAVSEQQMHQQIQQSNRIEDLYGKVNPNRYPNNSRANPNLEEKMAAINQQYKTLPSRVGLNQQISQTTYNVANMSIDEHQRAKSHGQLYEQIWSNNNGGANGQQPPASFQKPQQNTMMAGQVATINQINRQQFHANYPSHSSTSMEESKQMEPNSQRAGQNRPINNSISQQQAQRNYENQMVNSNSRAPPPAVMAKPALPPNKPSQVRFANRESNNEDENRLEMLKKRIEMLNQLEAKSYRTNEEENMLNKLKTEIEFDKRVIEMNSLSMNQGAYADENNEENDVLEYAPEVRERIAYEYMQRRKKFDEIFTQNGPLANQNQEIDFGPKPFQQNYGLQTSSSESKIRAQEANQETDRLMEVRREELRLKKHVEFSNQNRLQPVTNGLNYNMNGNSYQTTHTPTGSENEQMETGRALQKHVQFVQEGSSSSMPISPTKQHQQLPHHPQPFQNGLKLQQQQPTSSSSSSDQLDSSPSTPPPIPPLSTQPQPKRVMFSETSKLLEFDQDNFGPSKGVDNTPSVIGANEIYVDQRLKIKQQQQQQQQMAQMVIEGEKLSFKDKMRLFARQSGDLIDGHNENENNRLKVSRKQREIESKFDNKN